jgi:glutathione-regulated potassium-efflux system ancillary protein KefC/glutathione-regulated potassium-efflux system protein KefB
MDLLIFSGAAIVFVPLFRLIGVGAILAYLFAGIVIGPSGAGFILDIKDILHFSELGVVFLLFIIGLELAPAKLWRMKRLIFGMGLLQLLLSAGAIGGLALWLGFPGPVAIILGLGLGLSSTAFGIQLLEEKHQFNTTYGQTSFAILMFQDLAVVPILGLVTYLAPGAESSAEISWTSAVNASAIFACVVFASRYLMRHVMRVIADSHIQEVFIAMALFIVIGTGLVMEKIGFSLGMGAFLAGVLLADSEYRHELETTIMPFKNLLLGLFFIAVGMTLDLGVLLQQPAQVLFGTLGLVVIKGAILYGLASAFRYPGVTRALVAATLFQGGEFAFVIFSLASQKGLIDSELSSVLGAIVTLSMGMTPFVFNRVQTLTARSSNKSKPFDKIESEDPEVIIAGYGRFGQIVSRFLRAQNIRYTILEQSAAQVETARQFGNKIYYGDASRKDILEAAGVDKANSFVLAIDDVDKSIEVATLLKKSHPHLKIYARARNRQHAVRLLQLGITNVHRETYLTSLEVAREVLVDKGFSPRSTDEKIKTFRAHDEEILRKQMEIWDNQDEMIHFTTIANRELEKILQIEKGEK